LGIAVYIRLERTSDGDYFFTAWCQVCWEIEIEGKEDDRPFNVDRFLLVVIQEALVCVPSSEAYTTRVFLLYFLYFLGFL